MKMERQNISISEIIELFKNNMLKANPEYQRGIVWSETQKKKLIDSVFRGYPLPLIYLHHIVRAVGGMRRDDLEIIDGQQRIDSIHGYAEGAYKLFDPVKDDAEAKFPRFLQSQPCPWAGKDFHSLSEELKASFLATELSVTKIETDNENEVRDLFVRLQSGAPLNGQETRDAWPGQFTDYILRLGGKPELVRYPGHSFFKRVMRMSPASDRGKTRMAAAQIAMLFFLRRAEGPERFSDINSRALDDYYYAHIDFDSNSGDASRLSLILDKLDSLLGDGKRSKMHTHDAIHLILLVDTLWDDYTRSWEATLPMALDKFHSAFAKAKVAASEPDWEPDEFWLEYGQWTRVASDRGETIRRRHKFYTKCMFEYLQPLQLKDPKRLFGELEREVIYFQQDKKCAVCKADVLWAEAQVHHVQEHSKGGQTVLNNGALVHQHCHPKGEAATQKFAEQFKP